MQKMWGISFHVFLMFSERKLFMYVILIESKRRPLDRNNLERFVYHMYKLTGFQYRNFDIFVKIEKSKTNSR